MLKVSSLVRGLDRYAFLPQNGCVEDLACCLGLGLYMQVAPG